MFDITSPLMHCFRGLGPVSAGAAERVLDSLMPQVLPRLGAWARRTIDALPQDEQGACGYRDLYPAEDRAFHWHFPRSNSAERIEALWWLGDRLDEPRFHQLSRRYADCMINDPIRGIYQGSEEDGRGQVWYWTDFGLYMTNYTMRVPSAMLLLAERTGEPRYRETADLVGRQLIRSQQPTGILREGWCPQKPAPGMPPISDETRQHYLSEVKINSRVGYVVQAFAELHQATGEQVYRDALGHFLDGFAQYQNADGSFPQDIRVDRIEVHDPIVKGHYLHYILNGFARAATVLPDEPRLAEIARRLGWYLLQRYRQCGGTLYGQLDIEQPAESNIWRTATPDAIAGLAYLTQATGEPAFREAACRIALDALLAAFDCPQWPDLHGGVPVWLHPQKQQAPALGGYFHFWTLLGLQAIEATASPA